MYYVAQTTRINGKTVIWRPPPPSTPTFALGQPASRALNAVGTTMNRFSSNDFFTRYIIIIITITTAIIVILYYYYYSEQSG